MLGRAKQGHPDVNAPTGLSGEPRARIVDEASGDVDSRSATVTGASPQLSPLGPWYERGPTGSWVVQDRPGHLVEV